MIVRDIKRLSLLISLIIALAYLVASFYSHGHSIPTWTKTKQNIDSAPTLTLHDENVQDEASQQVPIISTTSDSSLVLEPATTTPTLDTSGESTVIEHGFVFADNEASHQEIFSASTNDRKFFSIQFGDMEAMNPNIIPHPTLDDTWIIVAQRIKKDASSPWFTEIVCDAAFSDGVLRCLHPPYPLPVAATPGQRCEGDLSFMNFNIGPHDARVFLGPSSPYVVYGSNSIFTCFGQFAQDFRILADFGFDMSSPANFRLGTELQRPWPWGTMEKNWFLFWDSGGQMYAHYDIAPKRIFAQLNADGSAGPDLGAASSQADKKCLARYLPRLAPQLESIHQATNSLSITMCSRADVLCTPDDTNTFIFTIYQHKTYYNYHSVYEPYAMLFHQRAPFEIYAMSEKPIWIHGRKRDTKQKTSEMFYVTSMSWKSRQQQYHGYLDDELLITFGIEDEKAGGIDVLAKDLLHGIGLCNDISNGFT